MLIPACRSFNLRACFHNSMISSCEPSCIFHSSRAGTLCVSCMITRHCRRRMPAAYADTWMQSATSHPLALCTVHVIARCTSANT